eukprot:m.50410 g.50410  ORF g.50410 m.50410 type:complete len:91 (+) comp11160_c0_seq1:228-500(+)
MVFDSIQSQSQSKVAGHVDPLVEIKPCKQQGALSSNSFSKSLYRIVYSFNASREFFFQLKRNTTATASLGLWVIFDDKAFPDKFLHKVNS